MWLLKYYYKTISRLKYIDRLEMFLYLLLYLFNSYVFSCAIVILIQKRVYETVLTKLPN